MAVWSEISKRKVVETKRIDAERYKPDYLLNENLIKKSQSKELKNFIKDISGGATPKGAKYPEKGIPFIRVQNVRENFWNLDDVVFIEKNIHEGYLSRSMVTPMDVLLTITGISYGNSTVAWPEILPANMNQHLVRISVSQEILPGFLSTFFISKYGKLQSDSKITGDTRPALTYSEIGKFLIPEIDYTRQKEVSDIVREAFDASKQSKTILKYIKKTLDHELGLNRLKFEKPVGYEANFSDAMCSFRVDAEHFYPEFDSLCHHLPDHIKFTSLSKALTYCQRGTQPQYSENGIRVINSKHVLSNKINIEDNRFALAPLIESLKINHGDVLINGTGRGTIGRAAPYLETESALPDNHVTILRTQRLDPVYLSVFLNSRAGQLQVEKFQRGSSGQIELYPMDIRKFLIWEAPESLQIEIRDLHEKASSLEKESKQLLEKAKQLVEDLIEQAAGVT